MGGGLRTKEAVLRYLDAGARSVMLGTKAEPEFLAELPRERLIAALDEKGGEVVVEGWTKGTGRKIEERMAALAPYVSGFLVTFVDAEGSLGGIGIERAKSLIASAKGVRITFAGGAAAAARRSAELDRLGADVQAGTAIALGKLSLAEAFAASLGSDRPDGLWPTVVCDEGGRALGLVWSDLESLAAAIETGRGIYRSRSRGLWVKGESSGDAQDLIRVEADCDRDAIRFTVRQNGRGFCHLARRSCFDDGSGIERLERTLIFAQGRGSRGLLYAQALRRPEPPRLQAPRGGRRAQQGQGLRRGDRRGRRRHLLRPHEGDRRRLEPGGYRGRAGPQGPAGEPPRRRAQAGLRPVLGGHRMDGGALMGAGSERRIRLRRIRPRGAARGALEGPRSRGRGGGLPHTVRRRRRAARLPCASGPKSWTDSGPAIPWLSAARASRPRSARCPRPSGECSSGLGTAYCAFAQAQRAALRDIDVAVPGGRAGHSFIPVARAGCYAPGGRFPLPSSAIMTACAAKAAGVGSIWCAGPRPARATLAAAALSRRRGLPGGGRRPGHSRPRPRRGRSALRRRRGARRQVRRRGQAPPRRASSAPRRPRGPRSSS